MNRETSEFRDNVAFLTRVLVRLETVACAFATAPIKGQIIHDQSPASGRAMPTSALATDLACAFP